MAAVSASRRNDVPSGAGTAVRLGHLLHLLHDITLIVVADDRFDHGVEDRRDEQLVVRLE